MTPLRILIATITLGGRSGTETYVRDLALGLRRRGHHPMVFTPTFGEIADELRAATIPVLRSLEAAAAPDVVHGNHSGELMAALLRYPRVPGVFVCHSWVQWPNEPPRFPRILRYLADDDTCYDRLVLEHGVPADRAHVLLQAVDTDRFRPRAALPPRPRHAVVFSNYASEDNYVQEVRAACQSAGVELDVMGARSGTSSSEPERELGRYDLVFAKARSALESLAVGAAVVLCDFAGCGGMVTSANVDRLRRLNFGMRALNEPVTAAAIEREIGRYDAADATAVSAHIRQTATLDGWLAEMEDVYRAVVDENALRTDDGEAEKRAAAEFVTRLSQELWLGGSSTHAIVEAHARNSEAQLRELRRLSRQYALLEGSLPVRLAGKLKRIPLAARAGRAAAHALRGRGPGTAG